MSIINEESIKDVIDKYGHLEVSIDEVFELSRVTRYLLQEDKIYIRDLRPFINEQDVCNLIRKTVADI